MNNKNATTSKNNNNKQSKKRAEIECPICTEKLPISSFPKLKGCKFHRSCRSCLKKYVSMEIMENRVKITCPECPIYLHPSDIAFLIGDDAILMEKFEQFTLRKFFLTESDARWCPAPDCGYAVIASNCTDCPKLKCERPECGMSFCYNCKVEWHENETCEEARRREDRANRQPRTFSQFVRSIGRSKVKPKDVKSCPQCQSNIVKVNDGSCNHMVCAMCQTDFCWLCLEKIGKFPKSHYRQPSKCSWFGKPFSKKKKLFYKLGALVLAPVGIPLIAAISVPAIIVGLPVYAGQKVFKNLKNESKMKRNILTTAYVVGSVVASPVLAALTVGVGIPVTFGFVYTAIPLSLCRDYGRVPLNPVPEAQEDEVASIPPSLENWWSNSTTLPSTLSIRTADQEEQLQAAETLLVKLWTQRKQLLMSVEEQDEEVTSISPSLNNYLPSTSTAAGNRVPKRRRPRIQRTTTPVYGQNNCFMSFVVDGN